MKQNQQLRSCAQDPSGLKPLRMTPLRDRIANSATTHECTKEQKAASFAHFCILCGFMISEAIRLVNMAVAAGLLSRPHAAPQIRQDGFEIGNDCPDAFGF